MAEVSIVDYGIGNTGSICNMFRKLAVQADVVSNSAALASARRLILPGIGAFDACMSALDRAGLRSAVLDFAAAQRPLLGICVGMQMLTLDSEEGDTAGLGLIPAHTRRFPAGGGLRVPHMGWDAVRWLDTAQDFTRNFSSECRYYFVHSFKVVCDSPQYSLATCTYGTEFSAAIVRGNIYGVQFHPEKSHRFGLQLLRNFAAL
jgi:imidazole glycerol-phosphate synthase subunit HisH